MRWADRGSTAEGNQTLGGLRFRIEPCRRGRSIGVVQALVVAVEERSKYDDAGAFPDRQAADNVILAQLSQNGWSCRPQPHCVD